MSKVQVATLGLSALHSRIEVATLGLSAPIVTVVNVGPDLAGVEPLLPIVITATWAGGAPLPGGWLWTQLTGPAAEFTWDNETLTITPPADPDGCSITMAASANNGQTVSAIDACVITVLPHLRWRITADGGKVPVLRQRIGA